MSFTALGFVLLSVLTLAYTAVPNVRLNNGRNMPILGLGTGARGPEFIQAVKDAFEIGYRLIDTANMYKDEKDVGQGLAQAIQSGFVKREDVFIISKVLPDYNNVTNQTKYALDIVKNSLSEMNVSYIDLYLLHWPTGDYVDTYKGLDEAYNQGLIKSIGVSNFNVQQLEHLLKSVKVKPVNNQIESHPNLPQTEIISYCTKLNISVTAYSPLGRGALITDKAITDIAEKHNKTAAQVLIRYQVQRGIIAIPNTIKKSRLKENFDVFDFNLTTDEIQSLNKLKRAPTVRLNNGMDMPIVGLGTWQANGSDLTQAVSDALEIGYRHIDTANGYKNEREVGQGLAKAINAGIVKREDVFITSKVYPLLNKEQNQTERALDIVKHSLSEMNVSYIDLYLIHFPHNDYIDAYKGLEEAYDQGLIKSIGVSNFSPEQIDKLLKIVKVKPVNNQIECHPYLPQIETIDYCNKNNISVTAYSPLGNGGNAPLLKDKAIIDIAAKYNRTAAQVLIRYHVQRGIIVIPKTTQKHRLEENFNVFDDNLLNSDIQAMNKMVK